MRIAPIDNPKGLMVRFAYWMSRRRLGKVVTPLRVLFARMPKALPGYFLTSRVLEGGLSLTPELQFLIQHHVATINGCGFCVDIGRALAIGYHVDLEKLDALHDYRTDTRFSESERAALAYVEEATRAKRVSDATFDALRSHFDEQKIVEITWLCALENYFNLINLPLEIESDGLCAIAERRQAA